MTRLIALVASAAFLFICTAHPHMAAAGSVVGGSKIVEVVEADTGSGGWVAWITLDKDLGSRPSCATAARALKFDPTTVQGRNFLATATAAFLAGKTVAVGGSGACTVAGGPAADTLNFLGMAP